MPRIVKRYENRKLYDLEAKQYVSLQDIAELIRTGHEITVIDNSSGEDLTAVTLAKIITDQKSSPLLDVQLLHDLLRSGGQAIAGGVERLVQASLARIAPVREMREQMAHLRERVRTLEELVESLGLESQHVNNNHERRKDH